MPADARRVPTRTSRPGRRTNWPGTTDSMIVTALESQSWVFSTMQTASAPSGNGAPVMIRTACPGPTVPVEQVARRHGTDHIESYRCLRGVGRTHGVAVHGRDWTNGGTSSLETMSSLRTHPSASLSAILCGGRRAHRESTQRWASASGITPARRWFPSTSSCPPRAGLHDRTAPIPSRPAMSRVSRSAPFV